MNSIVSDHLNINNAPNHNQNNNFSANEFNRVSKNIQIPPQIMVSSNYKLFKPHPLQRELSIRNLNRLRESIEKHDLSAQHPLKVILSAKEVSEENPYLIWDGNHRYQILLEKQKPIYFMISDSFIDSDITTTGYCLSQWNIHHFCEYFCKLGKEEYIKFRKFYQDFNLDIKTALPLTRDPKNRKGLPNIFREGKFIFDNERDRRHRIELGVQFLEKCITYKLATKDFYRNSDFFDGFAKLIDRPDFNMKKILDNVEKGSKKEAKIPKFSKFTQFYNLFKEDFLGVKPENDI